MSDVGVIEKVGQTGLSRVERRKQKARTRIIGAAEALMSERPIDEVKISDITEAADVGHGSFYLHFKSKYEVLVPIIKARAIESDRRLQAHTKNLSDPAEVLSFSARHMGRIIHADPLWRWFLEHSGVPAEVLHNLLGDYSRRDFTAGLASGRFKINDANIVTTFIFGGFVKALLDSFRTNSPATIIDNTMELMLRTLGIPLQEAKIIAHTPLEPLPPLELLA